MDTWTGMDNGTALANICICMVDLINLPILYLFMEHNPTKQVLRCFLFWFPSIHQMLELPSWNCNALNIEFAIHFNTKTLPFYPPVLEDAAEGPVNIPL